MNTNLFVYGTLMDQKTWNYFTSKTYERRKFVLQGFERKALKDRLYPGIIRSSNSHVEGIMYVNVTEEDIEKLDEYEGEEYDRITVTQDKTQFQTYLFIGDNSLILEIDDPSHKLDC